MRVPDRAADLERLWAEAEPLAADELPEWLSAGDAQGYRRVGSAVLEEQRGALEEAGLIADETGVYLADPHGEPVFSIGIYTGTSPFALEPAVTPALTRDDVTDVVASYVADPFIVEADGRWHMFFEVFNRRTNKGEIAHATSGDGLQWAYEGIVLAEEFHLSYPHVFEWAGERWLIPESFQAHAVRLYRADAFPTRWSFAGTLIEALHVVDASPFRFADRWWLFADTSPEGGHDTLRLYSADELTGPWSEHPASPIVAGDPTSARPAGRVILDDSQVIRLAQDCSQAYGSVVRAFEVTELTPTAYAERELTPSPLLAGSGSGWNADGMHHLDAHRLEGGGWIAAVDGWYVIEAG
jgi:hypothetical protein